MVRQLFKRLKTMEHENHPNSGERDFTTGSDPMQSGGFKCHIRNRDTPAKDELFFFSAPKKGVLNGLSRGCSVANIRTQPRIMHLGYQQQ
jgi:hypothetical protein